MKTGRFMIIATVVALPLTAYAEVMDKELSVPEIWQAFLWGLLVCAAAGVVWRWLLLPSFLVGLGFGLAFAWTEWFAPYVGPAIRSEAGLMYGVHANAALSLLVLAHIAAWFGSARFSLVSRWRTPQAITTRRGCRQSLSYSIALTALTVFGAFSGFSTTAFIWVSPPVLLCAAFIVFSLIVCRRAPRMKSR